MLPTTLLIGVISDTHGTVPTAVHDAFAGVDHIIHAGDFGGAHVLAELEMIAPVTAVLGNTDLEPYPQLKARATLARTDCTIEIVHDLVDLRRQPLGSDTCVLITGHTHVPLIERRGSVLHLNAGSPVRPRDGHPPTVALLSIGDEGPSARLVRL